MRKTVRTRLATAATAILIASPLAGCGSGTPAPNPDVYAGTIEMSAAAPATFAPKASWGAKVVPGSPVEVTKLGVLAFVANPDLAPGTYQAALLDPTTGKPRWTSAAISSPDSIPALAWMTSGGHSWAIASAVDKNRNAMVYAYDGEGGGKNMSAMSAKRFAGTDRSAPAVSVNDGGVMVSGVKDSKPLTYHPDSGLTSVYGGGLKLGAEEAAPVASYLDGFIVTTPKNGFAFASEAGGYSIQPPEGASKDGARVLAVDSGFVVAQWPVSKTDAKVAIYRISDGAMMASVTTNELAFLTDSSHGNAPVVLSQDGQQAGYANLVFQVIGGTGKQLDLHGAHIVSIKDGVAYARGAKSPLPAPTSSPSGSPSEPAASSTPSGPTSPSASTGTPQATPEPASAEPEASATGAEASQSDRVQRYDFTGDVAMDIASETALSGRYSTVPIGFTTVGNGIFDPLPERQEVFSVAVR